MLFALQIVEATKKDLQPASTLCVTVFFGGISKNPWKASMFKALYIEQEDDLRARCARLNECAMFKVLDTK